MYEGQGVGVGQLSAEQFVQRVDQAGEGLLARLADRLDPDFDYLIGVLDKLPIP